MVFSLHPLRFVLLLLTVNWFVLLQAQEERNKYSFYVRDHFSAQLSSGFNQTRFKTTTGGKSVYPGVGYVPEMKICYTFNAEKHFGLSLRSGLGFQPFIFNLDQTTNFYGTNGMSYLDRGSYTPFVQLSLGINFHHFLSPKWVLNTTAGGGISRFPKSNGTYAMQSDSGQLSYLMHIHFTAKVKPFIFLDFGINRILKNKDMLGLSISSQLYTSPVFTGDFAGYGSTSMGTILNRGNNIGLSLTYIFTRARRYEATRDFEKDPEAFIAAEKQFNKEKRFVDPKSIFVEAGTGLFAALNFVHDDLLKTSSLPGWTVYGISEIGIKKGYFLEVGMEADYYWSTIKHGRYFGGTSGSNAFIGGKLSLGAGKRFILKQYNYTLFNLHAGVGLGFQRYHGLSGSGTGLYGGTPFFEYTEIEYNRSWFFPTLYLALEKDFQLSKNFYISLSYRYDQGFVTAFEQVGQYNTDPVNPSYTDFSIKINGSAQTFNAGLKYKFVPGKKKN